MQDRFITLETDAFDIKLQGTRGVSRSEHESEYHIVDYVKR